MLENYLNILPKFDGESEKSTKYHIAAFQECIDNLTIKHEYVYTNIFFQILERDTRKWFSNLHINPIDISLQNKIHGNWKLTLRTFYTYFK